MLRVGISRRGKREIDNLKQAVVSTHPRREAKCRVAVCTPQYSGACDKWGAESVDHMHLIGEKAYISGLGGYLGFVSLIDRLKADHLIYAS